MDEINMYEHLLQAWTVAFERAIVEDVGTSAKQLIDKASRYAVEDWTDRLKNNLNKIPEIKGQEFDTIDDCINHHIENLIAGGMWKDEPRPHIELVEGEETVFKITVPKCGYQSACESGLTVAEFKENGQYRCQRLGCFVGAVQKYIRTQRDNNTEDGVKHLYTEDQLEKLAYHMKIVMDEQEGCQGFIFIDENSKGKFIKNDHPTQFRKSSN
ncbi:MAG: hypothetical protein ACRCU2_12305 [Planktothrix sp.]